MTSAYILRAFVSALGVGWLVAPAVADPPCFDDAVNYDAVWRPFSVAIGDLDGDLDLDLAVANWSSHVSILRNNGDGTFAGGGAQTAGDTPCSVAIDAIFSMWGESQSTGNFCSPMPIAPRRRYLSISFRALGMSGSSLAK